MDLTGYRQRDTTDPSAAGADCDIARLPPKPARSSERASFDRPPRAINRPPLSVRGRPQSTVATWASGHSADRRKLGGQLLARARHAHDVAAGTARSACGL